MEEIFEIRRCIEILANDIKVNNPVEDPVSDLVNDPVSNAADDSVSNPVEDPVSDIILTVSSFYTAKPGMAQSCLQLLLYFLVLFVVIQSYT